MPAAQGLQGDARMWELDAVPAAHEMQSLGVVEASVSEYIPAPQEVQSAAPESLTCVPRAQSEHATVALVDAKRPAGQSVHTEGVLAPVAAEYFPEEHSVQLAEEGESEYSPGEQSVHADASSPEAVLVRYFPELQAVHKLLEEPLCCPVGHAEQLREDGEAEYSPGEQSVQVPEPGAAACFPAAQAVQVCEPEAELLPAEQMAQSSADVDPVEVPYLPASHALHELDPATENVPVAHAVQSSSESCSARV